MQKAKLQLKIQNFKPQPPKFRRFKKDIFEKVSETGQFIYQIGDSPLLRQKSKPVPVSHIQSRDSQKKIQYLKTCLRKYRKITGMGRGITAVQVGIPERLAVIYMSDMKQKLLIIINPRIIRVSKTLFRYPEVCMSANPIIAPVIRPSWIEFEYYGENGEKYYWNMKDKTKKQKIYNRVFQHEIDHMDGIMNIDRVQSNELIFELDPTFYEKATFEKVTQQKG